MVLILLPLKVFTSHEKTLASDIYSFAMIIYELFHQELPYPWACLFSTGNSDVISAQIISALKDGKRPLITCNEDSPDVRALFALMKKCWDQNPEKRPSAHLLIEELEVVRVS